MKTNQVDPVKGKAPIDPQALEDAIMEVSAALRRLDNSKLNRRAVVVLLRDCTGLGKNTVEKVLEGIGELEIKYLKETTRDWRGENRDMATKWEDVRRRRKNQTDETADKTWITNETLKSRKEKKS